MFCLSLGNNGTLDKVGKDHFQLETLKEKLSTSAGNAKGRLDKKGRDKMSVCDERG